MTDRECPVCPCDTLEPKNGVESIRHCPNCGYENWKGEVLRPGFFPATVLGERVGP